MEPATWQPPKRVSSHVFTLDHDALLDYDEATIMAQLHEKLAAEGERLLRLLPPAPHGHTWQPDIELLQDLSSIGQEVRARLSYRLVRDSRPNFWR